MRRGTAVLTGHSAAVLRADDGPGHGLGVPRRWFEVGDGLDQCRAGGGAGDEDVAHCAVRPDEHHPRSGAAEILHDRLRRFPVRADELARRLDLPRARLLGPFHGLFLGFGHTRESRAPEFTPRLLYV